MTVNPGRFVPEQSLVRLAGVRTGLTEPVAYLAERDEELERRLGELGWRFYIDEIGLWRYFEEILGVDLDGDGIIGPGDVDVPVDHIADDEPAASTRTTAPASEAAFHEAMRNVYEQAKRIGYSANYFIQMVASDGGLATAKRLINSPTPSQGFAELWDRGRLDLTVEAVVLQPQFQHLFTPRELRTARRRLADHGYEVSDPPSAAQSASSDWYVNFGHGLGRDWSDARRYGFVSAGGGRWYSQTFRRIGVGDRLFVYAPQRGYVGVARATRTAVP